MKAKPQRDWAERAAEKSMGFRNERERVKWIAAALRRAEKRGYKRGVKEMAGVLTGTAKQRFMARGRDRSEG